MKTYDEHYNEFKGYCRTLTDRQLLNVFAAERERHRMYPKDECYHACYDAVRNVMAARGIEEE